MELLGEILVAAFLVISGIFGLVGSFGLIKLENCMQRLHAPTKATTVGVGGVLLASMAYFGLIKGHLSFHELLISLFLFLTAPITANFIAKAYMTVKLRETDLPPTSGDYGWAPYADPPTQDAD